MGKNIMGERTAPQNGWVNKTHPDIIFQIHSSPPPTFTFYRVFWQTDEKRLAYQYKRNTDM